MLINYTLYVTQHKNIKDKQQELNYDPKSLTNFPLSPYTPDFTLEVGDIFQVSVIQRLHDAFLQHCPGLMESYVQDISTLSIISQDVVTTYYSSKQFKVK